MQQKVVLATHRPAALKGRVAGEGGQQEAGEAAASAMVASAANTPSGRHAHFQRASMQSSPLAHGLPGSVLRTDGNGGGLTAAGSSPAAVRPPARPGGIVSGGPGVGIGTRPPSPGGGGHVRIAVGGLIRKAGGAGTALNAGLKPRTGGVLGAAKQQ